MTEAWAVVLNREVNVRTVSPTRQAAIINWLVTDKHLMVLKGDTDETIESVWLRMRGDHEARQVLITLARDAR